MLIPDGYRLFSSIRQPPLVLASYCFKYSSTSWEKFSSSGWLWAMKSSRGGGHAQWVTIPAGNSSSAAFSSPWDNSSAALVCLSLHRFCHLNMRSEPSILGKISSRGAGNVTMAIYISGIIQHIQHYKHWCFPGTWEVLRCRSHFPLVSTQSLELSNFNNINICINIHNIWCRYLNMKFLNTVSTTENMIIDMFINVMIREH